MEASHNFSAQQNNDGINHQKKQSKRKKRYRKCEQNEQRLDKNIEQTQHQRHNK